VSLKKELSLLEAVFKTSIQPIIVINATGIIQQYNPASEKLFQYTVKEMIGKNIKKLMPNKEAREHDTYLKSYEQTAKRHIMGTGRKLIAQKKDGSLCNIFLSISKITLDNEVFFTCIMNDVTLEKNLQQANKKLIDFNLGIIQQLENTNNYQNLIKSILEHFSKLFDLDIGHFYEYDHYQDHLKSSNIRCTPGKAESRGV
jgi:PAS domain S-box-containing protein